MAEGLGIDIMMPEAQGILGMRNYMRDARELVKDISRGANLDKNLPAYGGCLAENIRNYAVLELTFSACIMSESFQEYDQISPQEKQFYEDVMELVEQAAGDAPDDAALAARADELRKRITAVMEAFTSYTDHLICYEYVMERLAFRFEQQDKLAEELSGLDEEQLLNRIMMFLGVNQDKNVMWGRLQDLVSMVPVRMTKNALFDRISRAVSLYKGADRQSLDSFIYKIRSLAMLHPVEECEVPAEEIINYIDRMEHTDFSALDETAFDQLNNTIDACNRTISEVTNYFYSLQKIVNFVYALCIVRGHGSAVSVEYKDCMGILKHLKTDGYEDGRLVSLEGKIEQYVENCNLLWAVFDEIMEAHEGMLSEMGLLADMKEYQIIRKLISDSLFIDIAESRDDVIVDEALVKQVSAEITAELSDLFDRLPKVVKRAVMAQLLGGLPVEFSNGDEICEYVRTNLFGCQDRCEKAASVLGIRKMIEEEEEWRGLNDFLV